MLQRSSILIALLCMLGCKVPIFDIAASFSLADATWFAQEETLFVFYRVNAEQGLSDPSVIELTYVTDDERRPWTIISDFTTVHTHTPIDCGATKLCGSTSIHVSSEPRDISIRLRYHRDSELSLNADTTYNVVGNGPTHSHRSFIVYGVFDETNQYVQWRGRHQFPTLRNQEVQELGLRRDFAIEDQRYGTEVIATPANPYGYGMSCPASFIPIAFADLATDERAIFNSTPLPMDASLHSSVCSLSSVKDGRGVFKTPALARKNPQIRDAFPELRSPIQTATPLRFFLGPCNETISNAHKEMQKQRLLFTDEPTYCTDNWQSDNFVPELVVALRNAIETARPQEQDMVLVIALHHDNETLPTLLEEALAQVVPPERDRSTPRVVGAFVLDSQSRTIATPELRRLTLWCPSILLEDGLKLPEELSDILDDDANDNARHFQSDQRGLYHFADPEPGPDSDESKPDDKFEIPDELIDTSMRTCAVAPDNLNLELGPFSFGQLPILPSRSLYLDFIDDYSEAQAGTVQSLNFLAPQFTPVTDNVDLNGLGVATFMNNELISAQAEDAFSYCSNAEAPFFVFRTEQTPALGLEAVPIEALPQWHNALQETSYDLGLAWDFPYLLRMQYETVTAGSISAFSLSVPFGIASTAENYYGSEMWTASEFPMRDLLTQCTRFCDHPTFDSASVYGVNRSFRAAYETACYNPSYPQLSDSGFPYDP